MALWISLGTPVLALVGCDMDLPSGRDDLLEDEPALPDESSPPWGAAPESPPAEDPPAEDPPPPADAPRILPGLTAEESASVATLSPLPPLPPDPTNKFADDPRAARLGKRIFFDSRYSNSSPAVGSRRTPTSCVNCHAGPGLADTPAALPPAPYGTPSSRVRNSLGLINASYYRWVNWGGRFSAQWELSLAVAENPGIMASDRLAIAHLLSDQYRSDYEAIFGGLDPALSYDSVRFPPSGKPKKTASDPDGNWESMGEGDRLTVNVAFVNYGKSIAAYLRTLVSRFSRFDAFAAGLPALDDKEVLGLRLFIGKARCMTCHDGPNFTDDLFHTLGAASLNPMPLDSGRFEDIPPLLASPFNSAGHFSDDRTTGRLQHLTNPPDDATRGQFRTPSLRNVALTPPYMHAGDLGTLLSVIDFHDAGGGRLPTGMRDLGIHPLGLTSEEKQALVAFLGTLTSTALPAALLDPTR